jgi:hypothetical protein
MATWPTVAVALGSSAVAVLATLGALRLRNRSTRKEVLRREAVELRDRGAAVIGPISTLLADAEPSRLAINAINAGPNSAQQFNEILGRWARLRQDLTMWAAQHPNTATRTIADHLDAAVTTSISTSRHVAWDLLHARGADTRDLRRTAQHEYDRAQQLLGLLAAIARGELRPDEIAQRAATIDAS